MSTDTKDEALPLGSTTESLGKIDFDAGVPLDREEEIARKVGSLRGDAETDVPGDSTSALDLLFRTRLADLGSSELHSVPRGTSVLAACVAMREQDTGALLVVEDGKLLGILTARDVVEKAVASGRPLEGVTVDALMTASPTALEPRHLVVHALNAMTRERTLEVVLVDGDGRPLGVISARRIVDFLSEQFPEKVLNLPPDADQKLARREGG